MNLFEHIEEKGTLRKLKMLAGVQDYNITERSLSFDFKNSLRANYCRITKYHDKVILELRKKADNILEGKYNKLVFEKIIDINDFEEVFENQTGIYLSYEGL